MFPYVFKIAMLRPETCNTVLNRIFFLSLTDEETLLCVHVCFKIAFFKKDVINIENRKTKLPD